MKVPSSPKHVIPFEKISDLCEWDPVNGQPSQYQERSDDLVNYWGCINKATHIVGSNGMWRLCDSCMKLPKFKRYRKIIKMVNR